MATITGTTGADDLYATLEDDLVLGRGGDDELWGFPQSGEPGAFDGADTLKGGGRHDTLTGGAGRDHLFGDPGRDILNGGNGNDRLYGGSKDDGLNGDRGNDRLYGGLGFDRMGGFTGDDLFIFREIDNPSVTDFIMDFTQGEDRIVFRDEALGPGGDLEFIGTAAFSGAGQGEIRFRQSTSTSVIVDTDGDGDVDIFISLSGFTGQPLTEHDFIIG